jgi:peptide/nickel transport system substrate-binding protein
MGGYGLVARGPIPADTWAFDPALPPVQPDTERARALLDSLGWKVGGGASTPGVVNPAAFLPPDVRSKDGRPLGFTLLTGTDPLHVAMAHSIASQWAAIGVTVTVRAAPMLLTNFLEPRSFEAVLIDVSMAGDPDPYSFWHETQASSGQNYSGYKNRDMSEILEQARRTNDRNARFQFYQRFQAMFMDEVPAIPLVQPIFTFAVDDRVKQVQIGQLVYPSDRFRNVTDWYIVTRRVIVSNREP